MLLFAVSVYGQVGPIWTESGHLPKEHHYGSAWARGAVGSVSDLRTRGPGFDTRSGHILSLVLPLIQEGQLSVIGESMCTKYWLTVREE